MDSAYRHLLERLFALRGRGVDFDLARPRRVARALGHPQDAFRAIHVAGTNGKGSTAALIESALRAAGVRTGLYTSPHLVRFTERIAVAGREIARADIVRAVDEVERAAAGEPLTFFEIATLAAFQHFREQSVEVAVVEVGLGGRLDATNLLPAPLACVLCSLALDHQSYLGGDLKSIAAEKAGIIKPGCPVVAALPEDPAAAQVITERAAAVGAPLRFLGRDFDARDVPPLALAGAHQRHNGALAKAALEAAGLGVSPDALARGFREVRWPGRLERLGDVLLDCAHNPDAAAALALTLVEPPSLVFGALADKDAAGMLAALAPKAARIWLTAPPSPRAADPAALAALWPGARVEPDPAAALAAARARGGTVLVTGSTYLVGAVRALLTDEPADPIMVADPLRPVIR